MLDVGLHYLTLDRRSNTLSRGEFQRIRLATQIGSGLTGVCYVLDEPSIGLHQRDNVSLLESLEKLRDAGNTVLVVEHDEETIRRADWVLDLGPGAGRDGGHVVFNGPLDRLMKCEQSLTARYLTGREHIPVPAHRRKARKGEAIVVRGAARAQPEGHRRGLPARPAHLRDRRERQRQEHAGQRGPLPRAGAQGIRPAARSPARHRSISGTDKVRRVLQIDQSPIGALPALLPGHLHEGLRRRPPRLRRDAPGEGARLRRGPLQLQHRRRAAARRASGLGEKQIEMNFLPDMRVTCEECDGRRYSDQTLQITIRGKSIADVLAMTVEEALEFFTNYPPIERKLRTLRDVGLGYLALGQSSTTLSGGEAQRIKLTRELSKVSAGDTLYVLDEPTTGLHFDDVKKLLHVLHGLADMGNTLVVIEHNLEIIKNADHIIDLGPEGGADGGRVVASGTPEEVAAVEASYTAQALRPLLGKARAE